MNNEKSVSEDDTASRAPRTGTGAPTTETTRGVSIANNKADILKAYQEKDAALRRLEERLQELEQSARRRAEEPVPGSDDESDTGATHPRREDDGDESDDEAFPGGDESSDSDSSSSSDDNYDGGRKGRPHKKDRDLKGLEKPDKYRGAKDDVEDFLHALDMYFYAQPRRFRSARAKVQFAALLFRDEAQVWWRGEFPDIDHPPRFADDYNRFKRHLRARFTDPNQRANTKKALRDLKQTTSTEKYWASFKDLLGRLGRYDEEWAVDAFYDGLKPGVKDVIASSWERVPVSLDKYARRAIRADARLYSRAVEDGGGTKGASKGKGKTTSTPVGQSSTTTTTTTPRPKGVKTEWTEEQKTLKAQGRCFLCKQAGHLQRECPLAPSASAAKN